VTSGVVHNFLANEHGVPHFRAGPYRSNRSGFSGIQALLQIFVLSCILPENPGADFPDALQVTLVRPTRPALSSGGSGCVKALNAQGKSQKPHLLLIDPLLADH